MASAIAVEYCCVRCGEATDWEETLGSEPLCDKCWDKETDSSFEAELTGKEFSRRNQLAYRGELRDSEREANKASEAEARDLANWEDLVKSADRGFNRWYYRLHRTRILVCSRRYKLEHKAKISVDNHSYFLKHRVEITARRCRDYRANRLREIEYSRNYKLTHEAQIKTYGRNYYLAHKIEARNYDLTNKVKIAEVKHRYYLTHKAGGRPAFSLGV